MRMRQIALAAKDLAGARRDIENAFQSGQPFQDPGVETFGLNNWVFPVGETFLEVVSPVEAGTAAGRYLEKRGGDVLREAARHSPELNAAMETWKEIKFEFDTVDKLDVAHK